jgi:hypothetical protein
MANLPHITSCGLPGIDQIPFGTHGHRWAFDGLDHDGQPFEVSRSYGASLMGR